MENNRLKNPIKKVTESAFMQEFKEFINRGSVVDLAIGVAVGGAFTAIVNSLVNDMIMPIASLIAGGLDFSSLSIDVPNIFGLNSVAHIAYGNFLQNVLNFLIIAFTVFLLVKVLNRMNRKAEAAKREAEKKAADKEAKKTETTEKAEKPVKAEATDKAKKADKN